MDKEQPTTKPAPLGQNRRALGWSRLRHQVYTLWARLGQYELTVLIPLVLIVGGIWLFVELADEVVEGSTARIDETILLSLRTPGDLKDPLGPPWVEETMRDLTALGGGGVLILLTGSTIIYLMLQHKGRAALLVILAVVGGLILSQLLKSGFGRPRPDLVPHGSIVYTASFPSGHSMLAAATYLTISALVAQLQTLRRLKLFFLLLAVLITLLVGISRVYLGVHWPTDVLGGWTAGAVWALICWFVMWWLQQRGQVERPGKEVTIVQDEHEEVVASTAAIADQV